MNEIEQVHHNVEYLQHLQVWLTWIIIGQVALVVIFSFVSAWRKSKIGLDSLFIPVGVAIAWKIVLVIRAALEEFETSTKSATGYIDHQISAGLYLVALGAGCLFLAWALLELVGEIFWPSYPHSYSDDMDDKGRIYDSDGKVTGFFDKD